MIFYGNTMSGLSGKRARGVAVGRLGGFGATQAKFAVVNNVGFNEEWSFNDWKGGSWLDHIRFWKLAEYEPLDDGVITRANSAYLALKAAYDMGNDQAGALLDKWKAQISSLSDQADANTKAGGFGGTRSNASHAERARIFTSLNQAIRQLAGTGVPAMSIGAGATTIPTQQGAATTVLTGQVGMPSSLIDQLTAAIAGTNSTRPVSTSNAPPLVAMTNGPDWVLPAAIGGGGLIFLGLLFTLVRKKKASAPALAGYRRRRRR